MEGRARRGLGPQAVLNDLKVTCALLPPPGLRRRAKSLRVPQAQMGPDVGSPWLHMSMFMSPLWPVFELLAVCWVLGRTVHYYFDEQILLGSATAYLVLCTAWEEQDRTGTGTGTGTGLNWAGGWQAGRMAECRLKKRRSTRFRCISKLFPFGDDEHAARRKK